jgi:hypothetical protein
MRSLAPHRLQVAARKAWCLLVGVMVLLAMVHANTRYFYCEALGLSETDPCTPAAHRHACPAGALDQGGPEDCCQVIKMPSVPEGARSVEPHVPAAGVGAVVPATELLSSVASWNGGPRVSAERGRWRRPPRSASERRAQLMVFLA